MSEPERQVAVDSGQAKTPERAPGHRELKPPEWFEERLAAWVQRMGLNAWTVRTSYKPKLLQREARTSIRPHEESVVEAIAHALVRTAEQAAAKAAPKS